MINWNAQTAYSGSPLTRRPPTSPPRPLGAAIEVEPAPSAFGFGRAQPLTELSFRREATVPVHPAQPWLGLPARPVVDEAAWNAACKALANPPLQRVDVEEAAESVPVETGGAEVIVLFPEAPDPADDDELFEEIAPVPPVAEVELDGDTEREDVEDLDGLDETDEASDAAFLTTITLASVEPDPVALDLDLDSEPALDEPAASEWESEEVLASDDDAAEPAPALVIASAPELAPEPEPEPESVSEPEHSVAAVPAPTEEPEPLPAPEAAPAATVELEAAAEKVPFHKREITFRRNKKKQTEPASPAQPEVALPPIEDETVAAAVVDTSEAPAEKKSRFARAPKEPKPKRQRRSSRSSGPQKLVGLKIGASQLAAAVVVNDGAPEVLEIARTPFELGVVVDGEVRDEEKLTAALKQFFVDAKLPKRGVRIGLASNRIGVRTFEIAGITDGARFDNAVRYKAHEVLPIAAHESVLDYRILSERPSGEGEVMRRVLLVVAPREQVEPYVRACHAAGIKLSGLDLEAFALLRTFVEPRSTPEPSPDEAAIVVVAIGHESSTLVVSGAGVSEFTRVFGWGGASLDAAIAGALEISPMEASAIKHGLSVAPDAQAPSGESQKALDAVRGELTSFARELVSSLQFYQKQPDSLGIGELVVTGGTTHLDGLASALNTLVGVPVRTGDPLARVITGRGVDLASLEGSLGSFAVPIGLGIEDEATRSVNLLPTDLALEARRRQISPKIFVPAAAALPIVVTAALFLPAHSTVSDRQSQLADAQGQLAALPQPNAGPAIDPTIEGEQARRAAAVADVLSGRMAWDRVLRDVSRVLPGDVWLTNLKGTAPRQLSSAVAPTVATATPAVAPTPGTPTPAPTAFTLTGFTYSQVAVAKLLARLQTVPSLARVELTQSTSTVTAAKKTLVQFTIVADLREAGGNA